MAANAARMKVVATTIAMSVSGLIGGETGRIDIKARAGGARPDIKSALRAVVWGGYWLAQRILAMEAISLRGSWRGS